MLVHQFDSSCNCEPTRKCTTVHCIELLIALLILTIPWVQASHCRQRACLPGSCSSSSKTWLTSACALGTATDTKVGSCQAQALPAAGGAWPKCCGHEAAAINERPPG